MFFASEMTLRMKASHPIRSKPSLQNEANRLIPDMFRTLRATKLPQEHVFSVTVGASSKLTLASWHLLEPADVVSTIALLNGIADAGDLGAQAVAEGKLLDSQI